MSSEAFVTLATTDGYALGALVLAQSIRQVGTKRNLVVLISNHLSDLIRRTLETNFDEVILVEELNSNDKEHLELLTRPELGITFTKINSWLLEQYSKCVFLDSDCLVLRSIDDLFEREELSAASDAGWPDCFNSGVFVFKPSKDTFNKLTLFASQNNASFDGGDQGLLNAFFSNWRSGDISRHLPFTYNVTANAFYSYLPAVTRFRNDIHIVHFAGSLKPWHLTYNPQNQQLSGNLSGQNDIQREFILKWWTIMHQRVWPQISQFQQNNSNTKSTDDQVHSFGQLSGPLNYGHLTSDQGIQLGSVAHRRAWEAGHVDYYGRDSFDNIEQVLQRNMAIRPQINHPSQTTLIIPQKTTTSILKQTFTETTITTTPTFQEQQSTTNYSKSLLKETTLLKQTLGETTPLKKTLTETIPLEQTVTETEMTTIPTSQQQPQQQSTTNQAKTLLKESAPLKQTLTETKTTTVPTPQQQQSTTDHSKPLVKESTPLKKQTKEEVTHHDQKSLPEETKPTLERVHLTQSALKQSVPPLTQTTNLPSINLKETKLSQPSVLLSDQTQSLVGSSHLTENKSLTSDHETNWTVKSTIMTTYTQGVGNLAGPTVVSKVVSESSASTSTDHPHSSTIKQVTDPTILSETSLTGNGTSVHGVKSSAATTTTTTTASNGKRVNQ